MRRLACLCLATLALACTGTPARAVPYVLDKSHTAITFMVSHIGFSTVHGQFREFDASIDFDPGNVEATRVNFTIQTASIETFWPARDKDLRSRNFFESATYPTMTFRTTSVRPTGTNTAEIIGDLTIKDVTLPVTLEARLNKLGPSPFRPSVTVAGFTVTGEIDRTKFGISYAAPAIGAIIPIRIDLEMSPAQ